MSTRAEKLLAKGKGLEKKGKREQALQAYRDGCAKEPYDPDLWDARGEMALLLKLLPEAADAFFHVCDLFTRAGMPEQALVTVKRVLEIDANHGGAKRLLRVLDQRLGVPEPATPGQPAPPPADLDELPEIDDADLQEAETTAFGAMPPPNRRADTERTPPPQVPPARPPIPPPPVVAVSVAAGTAPTTIPPPAPKITPPSGPPPISLESARAATQPASGLAGHAPPPTPADAARKKAALVPQRTTGRHDTVPGSGNGRPDFSDPNPPEALDTISLADHLPLRAGVNAGENAHEFTLDDDAKLDVVQMVASTLTTSPLLSELDSDLVRHLIDCGRLVQRGAGDVVFHEQDVGTSLFLILSGEVAVIREAHGGQARRELARLRAGAFFGEMALLTNTPRTATVVAQKPSDFLEISRKSVRELIDRDPRILKLLMRFFRARLVGTLLQTSPLFKPLPREDRRNLVPLFRLRELAADTIVLREGVVTEGLFVVLVGKLDVTQTVRRPGSGGDAPPQGGVPLGTLVAGDVFGEMSLLDDAPASANVRTRTRSWVLLLRTPDYLEIAKEHPGLRDYLAQLASDRKEHNRSVMTRYEPV